MRVLANGLSLRTWLVSLAAAGGAAALLVAAAAGWWSWREQRHVMGASLVATSRAVTEAVDRELDQAVALARGLATSGALAADDIAGFERQARELMGAYGYELILKSPAKDHQLINTQRPPGSELPRLAVSAFDPALREGRVHVAALRQSRVSGRWVTGVDVPVPERDGGLRYVITILLPSEAFQRILDEQHLPASWSPVILDADWTVVARDGARERFLGKKGAGQEFQNAPDGLHEVRLLDGDSALSAHSHSRRYGWTAAIAMPEGAMLSDALRPILAAALSGFVMAALAIGGVVAFAARIGGGIRMLAAATRTLATGMPVELPRFFVQELTQVGQGLQQAAREIGESRRDLEARVAAATSDLRHETEERRKAEAALAQAQRLESLGQLTGGVAHDFNNLLMAISGNLELIHRQAPNEQLRRLANGAQRAVDRGARLIQALLSFARKQPLRSEVVNPNLVIKEFVPVLKGAAGDTVDLQLLLSPTVYPCRIDQVQFQSAVLNLVTNARAAMPTGGRLTIETRNVDSGATMLPRPELALGSYVVVSVSDTGSGMAPEVLARAFEPFFTTKAVGAGTGLGLSQVYGFAKQTGGDATIHSEPGVGTTVRLYLPRSTEAPAEPRRGETFLQGERSRSSATIMVVDDDVEVRAVLVQYVEALGYRATQARNGLEALERVSAGEAVDLVLTDHLMPGGLTGQDLAGRIARLGRGVRVLLVSGNPDIGENAGLPVLPKPVRLADLGQAIAAALGG